jgi:hypothetical protein
MISQPLALETRIAFPPSSITWRARPETRRSSKSHHSKHAYRVELSSLPGRQFLLGERSEERRCHPALEKSGLPLFDGPPGYQLDVWLSCLRENDLLPAVNTVEDPREVRFRLVNV